MSVREENVYSHHMFVVVVVAAVAAVAVAIIIDIVGACQLVAVAVRFFTGCPGAGRGR